MPFDIKRKLYESLPISLKNILCLVPFSRLAGKGYRTIYQRGAIFERASRNEILEYQERSLGKILHFAVNQIPAYLHLRPIVERMRPFEALKTFPYVEKSELQQDIKHFLPRDFHKIPHYEVTTGGTSGNQLKLFLDDNSQSIETGFTHRFWNQMGYTHRCRKATFRGVKFPDLPENVFWQYNPIYNEIQFSPFHMNENNLHAYVNEFIRYAPEYLHGYPSAIDTFADFIIRNKMISKLPGIKAAFLASESCSALQRYRIENAFRTRVFSWYGHTERVVFGGECEKNESYHHIPDYGILEIIDENGNPCTKEGERGEIVGTGLNNWCLPLIRYRTADYATRLTPECECGRVWDRFTHVEGRWKQDMIIGAGGSKISLSALNMHGLLFDRVIRFQYYQEKAGCCILKVVSAPGFAEKDVFEIKKQFKSKVNGEVIFDVQIVKDIPLTSRGKLKLLDSRLTA